MESPAHPLETLSTAVITLGGDIAWTVDTDLVNLITRPGFLPTLTKFDWTTRQFIFHGPPVQVAANLVSFWTLCHGLDYVRHPSPCCASREFAPGDAPGGDVPVP